MNRTKVKKTLRSAGFNGKVYFRKASEFMKDGGPSAEGKLDYLCGFVGELEKLITKATGGSK